MGVKLGRKDFLWNLYLSERDFIKHHEIQRFNVSNILGAIAAGLTVALGTGEMVFMVQVMICVLLIVMGIFGHIFCSKLYSLIKLHAERSYQYLQELDVYQDEVDVKSLKKTASNKNKTQFPIINRIALNRIWSSFHLSISIAGLVFLIMSITSAT